MVADNLDSLVNEAARVSESFRLTGKVAVVVGGTRGLGQAMALGLAAAGADVCIAGRGPAGLEETADAARSLGSRGAWFAVDASEEARVQQLMSYVVTEYGQIDILVNSQGLVELGPAADFDTDTWQRIMDVNVRSVFLCCKYAGRAMLARESGRIINISSVRGFQGRARDPAYATSKGAVNQLTRSLALEWGPHGVTVNAIAPAFTRTPLNSDYLDDAESGAWVRSRSPMGRIGRRQDFLGPVVFLASDASRFVNGHVLLVDGGWVAG